ncbi:hypothetical protein GALL_527720 [mine drainage metagenome]|uniref:Uncharacterized protein n=1 Tax=mine drainage metagenome TaxID=410659 RepID=A0A1J5PK43_9ZZZZ
MKGRRLASAPPVAELGLHTPLCCRVLLGCFRHLLGELFPLFGRKPPRFGVSRKVEICRVVLNPVRSPLLEEGPDAGRMHASGEPF